MQWNPPRKQVCCTLTNIAWRKDFLCQHSQLTLKKFFFSVLRIVPWIFSIYNSWRHCIQSEADTQQAWLLCWPVLVLQTTWGRLTEYGRWLLVITIWVLSRTYNYSFIIILHIKEKLLYEMIWNTGQSKLHPNIISADFAELWLLHNIVQMKKCCLAETFRFFFGIELYVARPGRKCEISSRTWLCFASSQDNFSFFLCS